MFKVASEKEARENIMQIMLSTRAYKRISEESLLVLYKLQQNFWICGSCKALVGFKRYVKADYSDVQSVFWTRLLLRRIWRNRMVSHWQRYQTRMSFIFLSLQSICRKYHKKNWIRFRQKTDRRKMDSFEIWCWRRGLWIPQTTKKTNKFDQIKPEVSLQAIILGHIMKRQ